MIGQQPAPARDRTLILAALLVLAAAGWLLVVRQSAVMGNAMTGWAAGMSTPLFLLMWVAMMVAMMLPAASPMLLTFARISASRRERGQVFVPTWIFVSAYLAVWTLFGVLAYGAAVQADRLVHDSSWLMEHVGRLGGSLLILAGLYQFSPLKHVCLRKCRTPLGFLLGCWREGSLGAFRMGLEHGIYCLGCCWLLFLLLFPLGVMNVAAMAVLTALILAEKAFPAGQQIARIAGLTLLAYGVLVIFVPRALPTGM